MRPVKVFVSYAHRDELRADVGELVQWLNEQEGIEAIADHLYLAAPPPKGWQTWMLHEIEDADVVLCICGEAYKRGFEKRDGGGKGVAYEGAIVTMDLYESGAQNEKFYPILPQVGAEQFVPTLLKPWNNHIALAQWERILALIQTKQRAETQVLQDNSSALETDAQSKPLQKKLLLQHLGAESADTHAASQLTEQICMAWVEDPRRHESARSRTAEGGGVVSEGKRAYGASEKKVYYGLVFWFFAISVASLVFPPTSRNFDFFSIVLALISAGFSLILMCLAMEDTEKPPLLGRSRNILFAVCLCIVFALFFAPPRLWIRHWQVIATSPSDTWSDGKAYSVYADGTFDLSRARSIRLTFEPSQAGRRFRLRLAPERADLNEPSGVRWETVSIPEDGIVTLPLKAEDFGLTRTDMRQLIQIAVLSGDNAWNRPMRQSADMHVVFQKIEVLTGR